MERICDEIALLHNGRIAFCGGLGEVKNARKGSRLEIVFYTSADAQTLQKKFPATEQVNDVILHFDKKTEKDMLNMMQYLVEHNIHVQRMEMLEATLEDLFMEVIGQ